ncbi:MAG: hypothetical protein E7159_02710 [Firmicutes bacterium]|nr:hypothetical protein [Bacillota bacterium]
MKRKYKIMLVLFLIIAISIIAKFSYAYEDILESNEYEIVDRTIIAVPTTNELKVEEFVSKFDSLKRIEIYDLNNRKFNNNDSVGTGYTLKTSNLTYNIIVLGDVTGDGQVSLGDVAKTYNSYRGKANLDNNYLEAGKVTRGSKLALGDVAKLYNFYRGSTSLAYYVKNNASKTVEDIEKLAVYKVSSIRSTPNTDISKRTGNIYYVSSEGNDNNDGLSESTPFKTMDKINSLFAEKKIASGSTVLFRDGDTFRGRIVVTNDDITLGSYGDISKGKPKLYRSTHDGAKEGEWVEVKPNIWKYTLDGSDLVFAQDVGTVWMFCNEGNNNCSKTMLNYDRSFEYAQKILTDEDYDESNIDDSIDSILKNDLEVYHAGHPSRSYPRGKALYLYSTSNPATRFDQIEFSLSSNFIDATSNGGYTNLVVDNLALMFAGSHAIGTYTVANLTVTNNEIAFIGGSTQKYMDNKGVRYGNAVQVWGGVDSKNGYEVEDGFVIENNYTYQVYDTGFTFQYQGDAIVHVEKTNFSNNVFDYMGAAIEYWVSIKSSNSEKFKESYVRDFLVENNLLLRSGYGIVETRPNKSQYGCVSSRDRYLNIVGDFTFKDNIFYDSKLKFFAIHTNPNNFPNLVNNEFYAVDDGELKFAIFSDEGQEIVYNSDVLSELYPGNTFVDLSNDTYQYTSDSGRIDDITWNFDLVTKTLTLDGSGNLQDFNSQLDVPWYKYKDKILHLVIGENITKLGNYSFYDLSNLITINYNCKNVAAFLNENSNDGNNYIFYNIGNNTHGIEFTFGENVSAIPNYFLDPNSVSENKVNITKVIFKGNNIRSVGTYGLAFIKDPIFVLNEGVNSIGIMSLSYLKSYVAILPDSLNSIGSYAFNSSSSLNRIVFGPSIKAINTYTFRRNESLKELVIPHIENTNANDNVFASSSSNIVVYGDSSTSEWVNNINNKIGTNKLEYKDISNYRINVSSNDSEIYGEIGYNESFTFTTNKNVKVYYSYITNNDKDPYDAYNNRRPVISRELDYVKNGNTYTINNIKSDIYIEVE